MEMAASKPRRRIRRPGESLDRFGRKYDQPLLVDSKTKIRQEDRIQTETEEIQQTKQTAYKQKG
jgi:hypothetical protein